MTKRVTLPEALPTKEELLIGLVGRGFLDLLDDLIQRVIEEPGLARSGPIRPDDAADCDQSARGSGRRTANDRPA